MKVVNLNLHLFVRFLCTKILSQSRSTDRRGGAGARKQAILRTKVGRQNDRRRQKTTEKIQNVLLTLPRPHKVKVHRADTYPSNLLIV